MTEILKYLYLCLPKNTFTQSKSRYKTVINPPGISKHRIFHPSETNKENSEHHKGISPLTTIIAQVDMERKQRRSKTRPMTNYGKPLTNAFPRKRNQETKTLAILFGDLPN